MYAITATATTVSKGWSSTRQIPTFYLDDRVQGILNETQAIGIAMDILCSAADVPRPRFEICAVRV